MMLERAWEHGWNVWRIVAFKSRPLSRKIDNDAGSSHEDRWCSPQQIRSHSQRSHQFAQCEIQRTWANYLIRQRYLPHYWRQTCPTGLNKKFAIIGSAEDIDRFCALAVTGNFRSDHELADEPTFLFAKVCPIRPRDRRACADEHGDGVLFGLSVHILRRTSRFVLRGLSAAFYLNRLLRDWPHLSLCCAVNEDMNSFGGIVAGFEGVAVNAVEDYDTKYDRKAHARRARALLTRWRHWSMLTGRGERNCRCGIARSPILRPTRRLTI